VRVMQFVAPQWVKEFYKEEPSMVIAPWCLHEIYGGAYMDFWREHKVTILDNEVFEKLQAPPVPLELDDICRQLNPTTVVLPDKLGDPTVTHWESKAALGIVGRRRRVRVMFVPHAWSYTQWKDVLQTWLDMWYEENWRSHYGYPIIGISSLRRDSESVWPKVGSRLDLMRLMHEDYPYLQTHLLGIPTIHEFLKYELPLAHELGIGSVDTPVAFVLGARGLLLTPDSKKAFLGDISQYDTLTEDQIVYIAANQEILRAWVAQGGVD